ncbi:hypothetical protein B0H14DRAFT_3126132, partial [Mycena olivaceomarginata]
MDHIIPRVEAVLDQIKQPSLHLKHCSPNEAAITAFESAAMMLIFWFIIILVIPFIGLHEFQALSSKVQFDLPLGLTSYPNLLQSDKATLIIRPLEDYPVLTLLPHDTDSYDVQFSDTTETARKDDKGKGREPNKDDKVDGPGAGEGSGDDLEPPQDNDNHSQNGGGEGGGDGADGRDGQEPNGNGGAQHPNGGGGVEAEMKLMAGEDRNQMEMVAHRTQGMKMEVEVGAEGIPQQSMMTGKFIVYHNTAMPIQLPLEHPLSQPKVTAAIDVEIETQPRQTKVDRSYASIGFVVHQNKSITRRKFFDRGFAEPLQTLKHIERQENQSGLHLTGGYSRGFTLTGGGSFNHTKGINFEATDSKPMAACYVEEGVGLKWNSEEENKSYTSYDVTYLTSTSPLTVKSPKNLPFRAQVGMGISIPANLKKLPQVSFVHRNQMLIWVVDPAFRGQIHGIMVVLSSFFDDIKEKEPLVIYEDATIQLGSLEEPQAKKEDHGLEHISLSIAQVQSAPACDIGPLHRSLTEIQPHEYFARGWDVTKNEWREVLWPELDKEFGKPDPSKKGKEPFWSIKCPAREA